MEYTVKSGDTLSGIALAVLGNGNRWPEIYNFNQKVIEKAQELEARRQRKMQGPNWIFPKTVLRLPAR